jgi:endonuclease V-like protein UPF0215 family
LAIKRFRQIKKEIRVIGVAAQCDPVGITIIGVVFMGSLWLDGVLKTYSAGVDITEAIAEMIKRSQHFGQVRVILLSRVSLPMEAKISLNNLSVSVGRPAILLGGGEEPIYTWRNRGEQVVFSAAGLNRWSAESILKASTREGVTPEAIRVATLTLSALTDRVDAQGINRTPPGYGL